MALSTATPLDPLIVPKPAITGAPIRVEFRPSLTSWRGKLLSGVPRGESIHATSFLRKRLIVLDSELARDWPELSRILVHELFHFAWVRLGNPRRLSYEDLLRGELECRARGELGWSAEWRKKALTPKDIHTRSRKWREYAVESFCDTAACLYSDCGQHGEYTLKSRWRQRRTHWFAHLESQSIQL